MKAIISTLIFFAINALATTNIDIGNVIATLTINNKGELILKNKDIVYQPWDTKALRGKVHVLQYLAGRMSASKINEPFTDKIDSLDFPAAHFHVTTIINLSDTFFGTSGFVISEIKSNKRKYPHASIVADKDGTGARQWQLNPRSSAIFVLSGQGKILFFKDGKLSTSEIDTAIGLIQQQLNERQGKKNDTTQ